MKQCENCSSEHDGTFGSGRFCSLKCSRGFSTKAKREDADWKRRRRDSQTETLKLKQKPAVEKVCPNCKKEFSVSWSKRNQRGCSFSCGSKLQSPIGRRKMAEKLSEQRKGEGNPMYGKSPSHTTRIEYISEKCGKIIVKSSYEKLACQLFDKDENVISYIYEPFAIPFVDINGDKRTYTPDFKLVKRNEISLVEVKPSRMLKLWNNVEKLEALRNYCEDNGYAMEILTEKNFAEVV